jgi:hypothetical protein
MSAANGRMLRRRGALVLIFQPEICFCGKDCKALLTCEGGRLSGADHCSSVTQCMKSCTLRAVNSRLER